MAFIEYGKNIEEDPYPYYYLHVGRFTFIYYPKYELSNMRGLSLNTSRRWYLLGFDLSNRLFDFNHGETTIFLSDLDDQELRQL